MHLTRSLGQEGTLSVFHPPSLVGSVEQFSCPSTRSAPSLIGGVVKKSRSEGQPFFTRRCFHPEVHLGGPVCATSQPCSSYVCIQSHTPLILTHSFDLPAMTSDVARCNGHAGQSLDGVWCWLLSLDLILTLPCWPDFPAWPHCYRIVWWSGLPAEPHCLQQHFSAHSHTEGCGHCLVTLLCFCLPPSESSLHLLLPNKYTCSFVLLFFWKIITCLMEHWELFLWVGSFLPLLQRWHLVPSSEE